MCQFLNVLDFYIFFFNYRNILLFTNEKKFQTKISIKIADFGNSKDIENYLNSIVGTPFYFSPEIFQNENYTAKLDVW